MRYKEELKEKAQMLRTRGKTYSEIMQILKIRLPKSTISSWCGDVTLPEWYCEKIKKLNNSNFSKAQKMAWASNKVKRERLLSRLFERNEHLADKIKDKDLLKMILATLYLGEGAKWRSHRGLQLGSSDPNIILLYMKLLERCYGIIPTQLKCWIGYRADQNIKTLKKYWSKITRISLENFYKSKPDSRTVGKPTKRKDYHGVCVISCAGTHIQLELEAIPEIILRGL